MGNSSSSIDEEVLTRVDRYVKDFMATHTEDDQNGFITIPSLASALMFFISRKDNVPRHQHRGVVFYVGMYLERVYTLNGAHTALEGTPILGGVSYKYSRDREGWLGDQARHLFIVGRSFRDMKSLSCTKFEVPVTITTPPERSAIAIADTRRSTETSPLIMQST